MQGVQRIIVLTGASRGLGLALARELVRKGHLVEACSRSGQGASELGFSLQAITRCAHCKRLMCPIVVKSRDGLANSSTEAASQTFSFVMLLLINAPAPLWRPTGSELHDVIAVNVLGTGYTLQPFLPSMIKRNKGLIIIVILWLGPERCRGNGSLLCIEMGRRGAYAVPCS
jgi:NAD(P)-dependent dehydrogenase (short-subunit alcohol dehydrogenase family)